MVSQTICYGKNIWSFINRKKEEGMGRHEIEKSRSWGRDAKIERLHALIFTCQVIYLLRENFYDFTSEARATWLRPRSFARYKALSAWLMRV